VLEHEELTERIIQAAIAVHRQLGPGFLESIYEAALSIELRKRGLTIDRQRRLPIFLRYRSSSSSESSRREKESSNLPAFLPSSAVLLGMPCHAKSTWSVRTLPRAEAGVSI
jgi:hypothetical protein